MNRFLIVVVFLFSFSSYSQNDTISVIRHSEKDAVVPKDLKVVYRAILNELYIDVPNSKSFKVSGIGITQVTKNLFNVVPQSGKELVLTIDIVLKNNKKIKEKHLYLIKNTSGLLGSINGRGGIVRMQKAHLKDAKVKVIFEDKNIRFLNNTTQFSLKIPSLPSIEVTGNKIDSRTYEKILNKASIGDQLVISDIRFAITDPAWKGYMCFKNSPVVIEIY